MQVFTYSKKGMALRSSIYMLLTALMADVVVMAVVTALVPGWWKAVSLGAGVLMVSVAVWSLTRVLRTVHRLDPARLQLQFGRFGVTLARAEIAGVSAFRGALPRGVEVPTRPVVYRPETDSLYILADKRGLVELVLGQPVEARVPRAGLVQFTRVVLSLDEPERFLLARGAPAPAPAVPATGQVRQAASTGEAALTLTGLRKAYGSFTAVDGISLSVARGEVVAFLGANGAGKTSTIKMITGLLRPTEGQVTVCGHDVWAEGAPARRLLGYVPDVPLLYEGLTAREFLWLVAGLHELDREEGRRRAEELLALLKLERWGDHLIRRFSLGMKRKMAIAAALVHRPPVLLLDEATNGLDPRAAREVKDFVAAAAAEGTAVFLTTHLLDVAEELAHRIAIIDRGQLRAVGTLAELRAQVGLPGASLEQLFLALTAAETGVSA